MERGEDEGEVAVRGEVVEERLRRGAESYVCKAQEKK